MTFNTVSFISDFGLNDEHVGVVKSIIRAGAPSVNIIDISHGIEPFDVRSAALMLARSVEYMAPGVVIGAVDMAGASRLIAIELGDGESVLLGPDNGLFAPVVGLIANDEASVSAVVELPIRQGLFAGRDALANAAVQLCNGVKVCELGSPRLMQQLRPLLVPFCYIKREGVEADVLHIDNYGNVMLNVSGEHFETSVATKAKVKEREFSLRPVASVGELAEGELGLLIDEVSGFAYIVMKQGFAARQLDVAIDSTVFLA